MPRKAKLYIVLIATAGLLLIAHAAASWQCREPDRYLVYLAIAILASSLKVSLPGIKGTMSVNYVFILLSVMEFSYAETMVMGCVAIAIQTGWRAKVATRLEHILFNCSAMSLAVSAAYRVYHALARGPESIPLAIAAAASAFFLVNTVTVSGVVALTESKNLLKTWHECYFWSFAYYLVGAAVAGMIDFASHAVGWQASALGLPVIYVIFRSYRLYLGKLDSEKQHAEEMAALHLRTIEALALAIEAKDNHTHQHLQRVQIYAVELGKAMNLSDPDIQALRAASILHDIGKLAVPEHILSKPGKLTPEEFEKMKIHPVVGAEILARVEFPYPVVPVVRCHHEKWNGCGYPDGLAGEQIPIGARILSAVDCLDALASNRKYRRALPLDEAMAAVDAEAGRSYDPSVVAVLKANYKVWEKIASTVPGHVVTLSKDLKIANGEAPGAGLETPAASDPAQPGFLVSIAAARQEVQMLYELTQDLGNSLNLHETLSVLDSRLRRLIPYVTMAVYMRKDERLLPAYVNGENFRLFSTLEIPMGAGLSGWVAETGQPILNGNPSVEPGYLNDESKFSSLRSAVAVALESPVGITGVLALYHPDRDAFSKDHLRVLLAINSKVSLAIGNAEKFEQASISATTDALTSLPNARSLFLHLDAELARCQRLSTSLAVLVCDLDGFKQVNDRFGHLEGNKALKLIAAGLRDCCREYDYVARMGGDEFVLVLPGLGPTDLPRKLQYLATMVQEVSRQVCAEPLMAISVGAAFYGEHGVDAESLLAEADRRMYLVKQHHKSATPETAGELLALDASLRRADAEAPFQPWDNLSHAD